MRSKKGKNLDIYFFFVYIVRVDKAYQMKLFLTLSENSVIVAMVLLLFAGTSLHFSRPKFSRQEYRKANFLEVKSL